MDTRGWQCVVYKFKDNTVDLDVKINNIEGELDTRCSAVNIHLTNILGERNYLKIIKNVAVVLEFSQTDGRRAIPISDLFKVLAKSIEGVECN
jgi:hypothetical protein